MSKPAITTLKPILNLDFEFPDRRLFYLAYTLHTTEIYCVCYVVYIILAVHADNARAAQTHIEYYIFISNEKEKHGKKKEERIQI